MSERREIEFLRTLGVGGFGAVYLANLHGRDRFVRRVAVKVMREGLDATPDLIARQKDEARLLGLLAHEGIVQVLDLAEVQGRPAVVMEYVEGVDLAEVLKSGNRRLPVRAALDAVANVAAALDAAYNSASALTGQPLRVIHRDIKPANLLLTPSGRVKVLDFGVARADFARDGHTTSAGWGTPRFMAPEQWLGEPYGAPIDTYALGVTLFDLLSLRPWERPPLGRAAFEAHIRGLLDAQPQLPADVRALIADMTTFDPAARPSAHEVRERAEALLHDAPGDSLARFARQVVPPLVEQRARSNATHPVPEPVSLSAVSEAPTPPERGTEPSIAPAPGSAREEEAGRRPFGLLVLSSVVGFGFVGVIGLSLLIWFLLTRGDAAPVAVVAPPEAAPPPEEVLASAPPVGDLPAATDLAEAVPVPAVTDGAALASPVPVASTQPVPGTPSGAVASGSNAAGRGKVTRPSPTPETAAPPPAEEAPPAARGTPAPPAEPVVMPAKASPVNIVSMHPFSVTSSPLGATVLVDGAPVGETPLVGRKLPAGEHTIQLTMPGVKSSPIGVTTGEGLAPSKRYDFSKNEWRDLK